ncbi:potassium channel family protein [Aquimarina sediminis]|uniref:potassium channel family protein n=1 Tax=Aquimarina sediminis TaxID=2070536 RepID=UPI000CA06288|nr:potassium channel family protein [Aquimarina sediminis]
MLIEKLFPYRFEIFFFSQVTILFGSLVFPTILFENVISPILFQINLMAGILLLSKNKMVMLFFIILLVIAGVVFGSSLLDTRNNRFFNFVKLIIYFAYYVVVTFEIVKQVWRAEIVNKNVIFGLISGYISLGLIGFFICLSIEMTDHGSFSGMLLNTSNSETLTEELMYFSYITILTIGYGDIIPVTALAKKASILIGLMGQFYLVIITAIIVGKYLNQLQHHRNSKSN